MSSNEVIISSWLCFWELIVVVHSVCCCVHRSCSIQRSLKTLAPVWTMLCRFLRHLACTSYIWILITRLFGHVSLANTGPVWPCTSYMNIQLNLSYLEKVGNRKRFAKVWASMHDSGPMVPAGFEHWTPSLRPSWTPFSMGTPQRATSTREERKINWLSRRNRRRDSYLSGTLILISLPCLFIGCF